MKYIQRTKISTFNNIAVIWKKNNNNKKKKKQSFLTVDANFVFLTYTAIKMVLAIKLSMVINTSTFFF